MRLQPSTRPAGPAVPAGSSSQCFTGARRRAATRMAESCQGGLRLPLRCRFASASPPRPRCPRPAAAAASPWPGVVRACAPGRGKARDRTGRGCPCRWTPSRPILEALVDAIIGKTPLIAAATKPWTRCEHARGAVALGRLRTFTRKRTCIRVASMRWSLTATGPAGVLSARHPLLNGDGASLLRCREGCALRSMWRRRGCPLVPAARQRHASRPPACRRGRTRRTARWRALQLRADDGATTTAAPPLLGELVRDDAARLLRAAPGAVDIVQVELPPRESSSALQWA